MKKEIRKFGAEVDKILHLMIHSLYTNKDIFLRELISNASDACDKLKYESNIKPDLLGPNPLKISITIEKGKKLLIVKDNGIGMNHDDLVNNLGTIASSGTQKFFEKMTNDSKKDINLIGQFGVGFYSVFMVAEEVWVKTRKAGEDKAYIWSSKGNGEFSIEDLKGDADIGTEIIIKLRDGEEEYLDKFRISHIVNTYSDHVSIPIELDAQESETQKVLNSSSALWIKSKSDITEVQYNEFYKKVASAGDTPWMVIHNNNEGTINYTNLLFIPSSPTFDMFHPDRKRRVKLYIKRVFINDEMDLVPHYLRFLRGIIDSADLPLNISRETLQHNPILTKIKDSITKKIINELEKKLTKDRESYLNFWKNFGAVIKEGLCEGFNIPDNLIDICLFRSAKTSEYTTLGEYVKNMPKKQKEIYYLSGDNYDKLKQHPQLDGFLENGYDVLMFTDTVDDFWVNVVHQYKDINLKSITRANIDLKENDTTENNKNDEKNDHKLEEEQQKLIDYCKNILKSNVADVIISKKLTNAPVCLSVKDGAMDIRMERYLIEQKQLKQASAKILEINIHHPIIIRILHDITTSKQTHFTENVINALFDQACVIEGEPVRNPRDFSSRFSEFIEKALVTS